MTIAVFCGAAGLSYLYLKTALNQSQTQRVQLETQLQRLIDNNNADTQKLRQILLSLKSHAKSEEDKRKWDQELSLLREKTK